MPAPSSRLHHEHGAATGVVAAIAAAAVRGAVECSAHICETDWPCPVAAPLERMQDGFDSGEREREHRARIGRAAFVGRAVESAVHLDQSRNRDRAVIASLKGIHDLLPPGRRDRKYRTAAAAIAT